MSVFNGSQSSFNHDSMVWHYSKPLTFGGSKQGIFFHLPGINFQGQNTHRTVTNTKYDVSEKVKQLKTGSKHGVHPEFPSME